MNAPTPRPTPVPVVATGWCADLRRCRWRTGQDDRDSEVVDIRLELVPDVRVLEALGFDPDDPAFAGTKVMTSELVVTADSTRVDNAGLTRYPDGISAEDHAAGLASSWADVAADLER